MIDACPKREPNRVATAAPLLAVGLVCALCAAAGAQQFEMTEQQFNSWLMNGSSGQSTPRKHLESALAVRIAELDDICGFDDAQRQKLQLAGAADIGRFTRRVRVVKRKLVGKKFDQNDINEPWQQVQPLSQEWQRGIFSDESLLEKVVSGLMTDEQIAEYERRQTERWNRQYHTAVLVAIASIERAVPMTAAQRQRFVDAFGPIPRPKSGDTDYLRYLVYYHLSTLPEEELKAIFDDAQFAALGRFRQQGRQMENFLKQRGLWVEPEQKEQQDDE